MVQHDVHHDFDALVMGLLNQFLEGRHIAKMLIQLGEILGPVSMVGILLIAEINAFVEIDVIDNRRNPQCIDA
ncbi:hypothetical protein D3C73_1262650 [compost metagenome]